MMITFLATKASVWMPVFVIRRMVADDYRHCYDVFGCFVLPYARGIVACDVQVFLYSVFWYSYSVFRFFLPFSMPLAFRGKYGNRHLWPTVRNQADQFLSTIKFADS